MINGYRNTNNFVRQAKTSYWRCKRTSLKVSSLKRLLNVT